MLLPGIASPRVAFLQVVVATSLLLGLAGVLTAPTSTLAQTAEWRPIAAEGPAARWDHTLAADPETGTPDPLRRARWRRRALRRYLALCRWARKPGSGSPARLPRPASGRRSPSMPPSRASISSAVRPAPTSSTTRGASTSTPHLGGDRRPATLGPSPATAPPPCSTANGSVLVSHGFTFEGRFDDTWSLDPATGVWTDISPRRRRAR